MKLFAVVWENDCGYGTDYFETEAQQAAFVAECERAGASATAALTADLSKAEQSYDALKLTDEELTKLMAFGHPGVRVSIAQSNVDAFREAAEASNLVAAPTPRNFTLK